MSLASFLTGILMIIIFQIIKLHLVLHVVTTNLSPEFPEIETKHYVMDSSLTR